MHIRPPLTALPFRAKPADMVAVDKLAQITQRFDYVEARLNAGGNPGEIANLSREYSELGPVIAQINAYRRALDDLAEAELMLADPEMKALAQDEMPRLKARIPEMEQALRLALLPKDSADARPAILEIRPGTGGEEASLFAADLLRMYQKYCERMGWTFEIMEEQIHRPWRHQRELTAHIQGEGVFARMKFQIRRPSGATRADDRSRRPYPYLCRDRGRTARGAGGRC